MKYNFSVLMSCYFGDHPELLYEAVYSVGPNQVLEPDEIILVIDGPISFELESVIRILQSEISYLKILRLRDNVGLGEALNCGLNFCSNEIIARMDSDDISLPNRFKIQINYFVDLNLDLLSCYIQEFSEQSYQIREVPLSEISIRKSLPHRSPFNHVGAVFRKSKVIEAGGYETLLYKEDVSLWIRMLNGTNDLNIANLPVVLVKVRFDISNMLRRRGLRYLQSEFELLKLFLNLKGYYRLDVILMFMFRTVPARLAPVGILKYLYSLSRVRYVEKE